MKEISRVSILSIKKEVEKVAKEQEKLNTIITTKKFVENLVIRKEIAEFNYLNYFFVYNTKRLLPCLVGVNTVTIAEVYTQALIMGISQNNIQTTVEVFKDNYMITIENEMVSVTPRAKRFLGFIGFGKKLSDELISKLLNDYLSKSK